jgi:signal transduction histidine kinase
LCAIKYAAENIDKWIGRLDDNSESKFTNEDVLREVSYRTRDIIAVQDNMASQLMTVMHYTGHTRLLGRSPDMSKCDLPYTQIFMRLVAAKKGMSDCYSRSELKITFDGKTRADEKFLRMPALAISVGAMYLAVRNIAENAIKYSRKGAGPRLDVSWVIKDGAIEYAFRDYGIGILEAEQQLIGREGFRGKKAQEMQLRGNGLGLAVCRAAVGLVDGSLTYREPDDDKGGSTFVLRIPLQ